MKKAGRKRGFTLLEVMLAVALFGIVAAAALAPLVSTVSALERAQNDRKAQNAERSAIDGIFESIRRTPGYEGETLRIVEGGFLSGGDSVLIFFADLSKVGRPAATVVYKGMNESGGAKGGLYRWEFYPNGNNSGQALADVETRKLAAKDGKLVIANVRSVRFYAFDAGEWQKDYFGGTPIALKIEYEQNGQKLERAEYFK